MTRDSLADAMLIGHSLIAGTTGSGKSTFLDTTLNTVCTYSPSEKKFAIIDLKRVSILRWKEVPHCMRYTTTPEDAMKLIRDFEATMERRYEIMEQRGEVLYTGCDFYLIIDEAADLLDTVPDALPILKRLMRLGRAAKVHCIYCTQDPSRKCLDHALVQNMTNRLALRCADPIESRQAVGYKGAEKLARYGEGLLRSPEYTPPIKVKVHMTSDQVIEDTIGYWKSQTL